MPLNYNHQIDAVDRSSDEEIDRTNFIRMDKNERIIDFPAEFIEKIRARIGGHILTAYPNVAEVQKLIAAENEVLPDQVFLSAGSEYSIKSILETFLEPGKNIVVHQPGYAMYPVYARLMGATVKSLSFSKSLKLDIRDVFDLIDKNTRLVVLENPNGFIGAEFQRDEIDEVAKYCLEREIALVVDEAYFYFSEITCLELLPDYPNLIITRTYSKAFGLAGVRVGYCMAQASTMELIRKSRPMHEISGFACEVVKLMHGSMSLLRAYIREIGENSRFFVDELSRLGIQAMSLPTNFILAALPVHLDEEYFREHKILVRRPYQEEFLKGYTRITVGSKVHIGRFIEIVEQSCGT